GAAEPDLLALDVHDQAARAADGVTLHDDHGLAGRDAQGSGERGAVAGAAVGFRRRLPHAHGGRPAPCVRHGGRVEAVADPLHEGRPVTAFPVNGPAANTSAYANSTP